MKFETYPARHPRLITRDFGPVSDYFGLIDCEMLAPARLHVPVLPMRHDDKLYFPLCAACVRRPSDNYCEHDDDERALRGTWTTPEINLALEFGYGKRAP